MTVATVTKGGVYSMAKFMKLFGESVHAYYINVEMIEQVDPESNTIYMTSEEEYRLNDEDFKKIMDYVRENSI